MQSKQGASTEIVKLFNDWDVGDGELIPGMGMATTNRGGSDGFGDKKLGDKEIRQGLNFLLSTKLNDNDARRVVSMIDKDGDGEINVQEFLDVALSEEMAERLRLHEWRKRRHLIPEERRRIIEARRHQAKPPRFRTGRIHPDDTEHQKMLRRARRDPAHRKTFNQPERVIELLRKRKTLRQYLTVCRGPYFQTFFAVEHLEINAMQLQAIESKAEAFESFCRKTGSVDNIEIEDAADKLSECMNTLTEYQYILELDMYPGTDINDDKEKYMKR